MELVLLDQSKDKLELSFILKKATPALANAVRRAIISLVPTLAIEDLEIIKNSSVLYDEMLAHRLGLIPLITDLSTYVLPEKCKCNGEGCASCQVKFTLSAKGPCKVYAKDVKFHDPKIKAVYGDMLIVELDTDQEMEVQGVAVLGRGRDHAKFSPGVAYYKYKPAIVIEEQPDDVNYVASQCPKDVFEVKSGKLEVNKDKVFDCHLCEACVDASNGKIKLNEKNDEFLFYVESFGQLTAKEMVKNAVEVISEAADEFAKAVKKLE